MKGNMFLGYAAGSVGDVTFSRSKGQQVARARNRKPNNPKTTRQMAQRSLFISAVKFYTRGIQNFFKFAFEDKKAVESDYNAFMRVNAKNGSMLRKADFENTAYPSIGKWVVSQGSLTTQRVKRTTASGGATFTWAHSYEIIDEAASPNATTIGQISKLLIESGEYMQGDILTFLYIESDAKNASSLTEPITPGNSVNWKIEQFIVDVADERPWNDTLELMTLVKSGASSPYSFRSMIVLEGTIAAYAVILSRDTDAGTKVSTQTLINSNAADNAFDAIQTDEYKNAVLQSWGANENAILQGIIAYRGRR